MSQDNLYFMNFVLGSLLRKIIVPADYHNQVNAVKTMLKDDVSGLVDSLTDFAVQSASVEFAIETDNPELTKKLNAWLSLINIEYPGIPTGINALAKEYYKERWKSSSFPILKMPKWEVTSDGLLLPIKMAFVDGEAVHASDKSKEIHKSIDGYDYFLDKEHRYPLQKNCIITKPYSRWFDKYPTPFLIKRGIYHNWKLIQSLKDMQGEIVQQVIPYMLLIKKGTEALAVQKDISYSDEQLGQLICEFQDLINNYKELSEKAKTPVRATNFDEELKHLIPDLTSIFKRELFEQTERNLLAGLGFIDVEEAVSSSRRESVLNPKGFIQEVKDGVSDFKDILKEIVLHVVNKNKEDHPKYSSVDVRVVSSPITGFMTDKFKERIRQLYDRGMLSKKTTVELIGEVDYGIEKSRRHKESVDGDDLSMYPPVTKNQEGTGIDFLEDKNNPQNTNQENQDTDDIPDDKSDPVEKENYDLGVAELEGAPYQMIKDLPKSVKNNLNSDLQKVFLTVFNKAYNTYDGNEDIAFRVAWKTIKKIARKDKKGIWVRRKKRSDGKLKPVKVTKAMIDGALEVSEQEIIDEATSMRSLELSESKKELLKKLKKKG